MLYFSIKSLFYAIFLLNTLTENFQTSSISLKVARGYYLFQSEINKNTIKYGQQRNVSVKQI